MPSKEIDNKVVKLEFDNKNFESNVKQSMSTLQKLKNLLMFRSAEKSLDRLEKEVGGFSGEMQGLEQVVQQVTDKMAILELIGKTALVNLTNKAVDAGLRMAKSLSVDNVAAGWQKYNDKTSSVQTIMSADPSLTIEKVNAALDRLNGYTDETSYNFVDMVGNIGKFMSVGRGLDESVSAMEGIANWAAAAGAGTQKASAAMYNISQAMGTGYVQLIDWKSIENANMATKEMKELMIQVAKQKGTLSANSSVTSATFNSTLSDKWLTADVLIESLNEYNWFYKQVEDLSNKYGTTITETLGQINDVHDEIRGGKTYEQLTEEQRKWYVAYNGNIDHLSIKAFKAAQEAKTWGDAIAATQDAVSTGWMKTFEHIFGNYDEAKVLWTDLAEILYDLFASGGEFRNEVAKFWHDFGGRTDLFNGIFNMFSIFIDILDRVKQAFANVFFWKDSENKAELLGNLIFKITKRFREFAESMRLSDGALNTLQRAFEMVFKVGKVVISTVTMFVEIGVEFVIFVKDVVDGVLNVVDSLHNMNNAVDDLGDSLTWQQKVLSKIRNMFIAFKMAINVPIKAFGEFITKVKSLHSVQMLMERFRLSFVKIGEKISSVFKMVNINFDGLFKTLKMPSVDDMVHYFDVALTWLIDMFDKTRLAIQGSLIAIDEQFKNWGVYDLFDGLIEYLMSGFNQVMNFFTKGEWGQIDLSGLSIFDKAIEIGRMFVSNILKGVQSTSMKDILSVAGTAGLVGIIIHVGNVIKTIKENLNFGDVISNAANMFRSASQALQAHKLDVMGSAMLRFAQSIGILTVSMIGLAQIPERTLTIVTAVLIALTLAMKIFFKTTEEKPKTVSESLSKFFDTLSGSLTKLVKVASMVAIVITLISTMRALIKLLNVLRDIKFADYADGLKLLGTIALSLTAFVSVINMLTTKWSRGKGGFLILSIAAAIGILSVALRNDQNGSKTGGIVTILREFVEMSGKLVPFILALSMFTIVAGAFGSASGQIVKSFGLLALGMGAMMIGLKTFVQYFPQLCKMIVDYGPLIVKAVTTVVAGIIIAMYAQKSRIALTIVTLLYAVGQAMEAMKPQIMEKIVSGIVDMIDNLVKFTGKIVDAAIKLVVTVVNEVAEALRRNTKPLLDAAANLVDSVFNTIAAGISRIFPFISQEFAKGLVTFGAYTAGINLAISGVKKVATSVKSVGTIITAFKDGFASTTNTLVYFKDNVAKYIKTAAGMASGNAKIVDGLGKFGKALSGVKLAGISAIQMLGGFALALPVVIAGLTALFFWIDAVKKKEDARIRQAYGLDVATKKQLEAQNTLIQSHREMMKTYDEGQTAVAKEVLNYQALTKEYDSYLNAEGKVRAGYEAKADLILGKVSHATGVEKEELQGLIEQYGSLTEAANTAYYARAADRYLSEMEDEYFNSLGERDDLEINLKINTEILDEAREKLENLQSKFDEYKSHLTKQEEGYSWEGLNEIRRAVEQQESNITDLVNMNSSLKSSLDQADGIISTYEEVNQAKMEGNAERIRQFVVDQTGTYKHLTSELVNMPISELGAEFEAAAKQLEVVKNSDLASDSETLKMVSKNYNDALKNLAYSTINGSEDSRLAGLRYAGNFAEGLKDSPDIQQALNSIINTTDLSSSTTEISSAFLSQLSSKITAGETDLVGAKESLIQYFNIPQESLSDVGVSSWVDGIVTKLQDQKIDSAMASLKDKIKIDDISALGGFQETADNLTSSIGEYLGSVTNTIGESATSAMDSVVGVIKAQAKIDLTDSGRDSIDTFVNGITSKTEDANTAGKNVGESAKSGVESVSISESADHFANGFIWQLGNRGADLYDSGSNAAKQVNTGFNTTLDINSPSRKAMWSAQMFGDGFIIGLKNMGSKVYNAAHNLADNVMASFSTTRNLAESILQNDSEFLIRPGIDLTDIQNGSNHIMDILSNNHTMHLAMAADAYTISPSDRMKLTMDASMGNIMADFNKTLDEKENPTYVFQSDTYLDGRKVGKGIAKYTKKELDDISLQTNRFGGINDVN